MIFIDNACLPNLGLAPSDFFKAQYQLIIKACFELFAAEIPIDLITITNLLKEQGTLESGGHISGIAAIIDSIPSAANVSTYAKIVKDKAIRRRLIESARAWAISVYDDEKVEDIIDEAYISLRNITEEIGGVKKTLAEEVREWVLSSSGVITSSEFVHFRQLSSLNDKKNLSKIFERLIDEKIIERVGNKNGHFRRIEDHCEDIDFLTRPDNRMDIRYPFGLENYIYTMPKNIIVCAGSPDSGKTAFFLNFVKLNQDKHPIHYFSSEMGAGEFHERLKNFNLPMDSWKLKAKERSGDFADVIVPDAVNVIDFLECHEDFWKMGGAIKAIFDKLTTGIALIGIQKAPGAAMGRGGVGTLEKPRLYLSMEHGVCKIEKAKNWIDGENNPNGLQLKYRLIHGCKYLVDEDWHKEDAPQKRRYNGGGKDDWND